MDGWHQRLAYGIGDAMTSKTEWAQVWRSVKAFVEAFPNDTIAIGGIAVYLHALHANRPDLPAEFTHDADFLIGAPSWSDIRGSFQTSANRRLSKYQIVIDNIEFDLYLERNHKLRVDFPEMATNSVKISGVRVAGLEHLLLLKLEALYDRYASAHGAKDRRDVGKILVMLAGTKPHFVLVHATDKDVRMLDRILNSATFYDISNGNAHAASKLKRQASIFVDALHKARK